MVRAYNRSMSPTTTRRLAAVQAIRARMLQKFRSLPHVERDVEHEQAVARACSQLDHMADCTGLGGRSLYVR